MSKIIAAIIVLVVIIGGIFLFKNHSSAPSTEDLTATTTTSAPHESINPSASGTVEAGSGQVVGPADQPATYTLAQVAQHADRSSCYSAINGNVYDLTNWINEHPGGAQRILSICGRDGSTTFNGQHGGDPRVATILASMRIGALAQ